LSMFVMVGVDLRNSVR